MIDLDAIRKRLAAIGFGRADDAGALSKDVTALIGEVERLTLAADEKFARDYTSAHVTMCLALRTKGPATQEELATRLVVERDEARRERDELRATLAKLSEAATAFDDDLSSDCDCLSWYDLRDAVKAADNAAKVSP